MEKIVCKRKSRCYSPIEILKSDFENSQDDKLIFKLLMPHPL